MRKHVLFPTVILSAAALAVPSIAAATSPDATNPATSNTPACDAFGFAVDPLPETGGTYTVTAQYYDSETITPVGAEVVFTGELSSDNLVTLDAAATGYLLWTYRFEFPDAPKLDVVYGERQLDCRVEEDPEEPGDDIPLIPLEPATPSEEEPDTPLTPLEPAVPVEEENPSDHPEAPASPVRPATTPTIAATPVVAEPRTAG